MDTQTFWTTVALIGSAITIVTPLAHRALDGDASRRPALLLTGALATLSFSIEAGLTAAAMTLPWLGVGIALAVREVRSIGLAELVRCPNLAVIGPLATWSWMAAGAGWLTAHRLGVEPFGFDRAITLLTVAHFHVAGLGLSAVLTVTHLRRPRRVLLAAIWLHQAGMLAVAAGITFNDHLEVAGALGITAALSIWALTVVEWIRTDLQGLARLLLAIAALAWVMPMVLAIGWALGPFLPEPVVATFLTMLRFHAAAQTFGLVICGLAGLLATERAVCLMHGTARPTPDSKVETDHVLAHQTNA